MPAWQPEAATRSTEKAMTPQGHAGIGSGPTETMGNIADTGLRHRAGRDHPVQREPAPLREQVCAW